VPTGRPALPSLPKTKEESTENLPTLIKRIKPSVVIVFAYDNKGEFLKLGSGFFISQNGDVITNYHVIQGASSAEIKTADEKTYPITYIVAGDEQNDLIRLSVNIPSQYVYPLSLSKAIPEVGERIIVYGSPLGLEKTVSDGIISAIREVPGYGKLIQITAPISPGSSGSPVLNMNGEVIGIATFQMIEGQNLNFAIPSERIANLILPKEKETFTTEELFGQDSKAKKGSDYSEAVNKALYFINKEEYEKALPYLEIETKANISPYKAWAYFQIGFCYGMLGAYTKEIEAYKQSIRIDPNNADVYHCLGITYSCLGYYIKAIEAYKQAIRIDPNNAGAYHYLGYAYGGLGYYDKAIEAYKQSICINPEDADVYFRLGIAYHNLEYHTKAIEAYKQAIRIDPNDVAFYNNLGITYVGLGYYTKAIDVLKQAIRIDPNDASIHYVLGITFSIIEDYHSALNEYKILKDLDIDLANELFDMIY
jgi:tetratricopeptide (TPR) repeat protein